jgi:hypothetical protein
MKHTAKKIKGVQGYNYRGYILGKGSSIIASNIANDNPTDWFIGKDVPFFEDVNWTEISSTLKDGKEYVDSLYEMSFDYAVNVVKRASGGDLLEGMELIKHQLENDDTGLIHFGVSSSDKNGMYVRPQFIKAYNIVFDGMRKLFHGDK